jgi:hypothetical protein
MGFNSAFEWLICTIPICFPQTPGWSERFSIRSSSPCLAIAGRFAFVGALYLLVRDSARCCTYEICMITAGLFFPTVYFKPCQLRRGGGSPVALVSTFFMGDFAVLNRSHFCSNAEVIVPILSLWILRRSKRMTRLLAAMSIGSHSPCSFRRCSVERGTEGLEHRSLTWQTGIQTNILSRTNLLRIPKAVVTYHGPNHQIVIPL